MMISRPALFTTIEDQEENKCYSRETFLASLFFIMSCSVSV